MFDGWSGRVPTVDGSIHHHDARDLSLISAWGMLTNAEGGGGGLRGVDADK